MSPIRSEQHLLVDSCESSFYGLSQARVCSGGMYRIHSFEHDQIFIATGPIQRAGHGFTLIFIEHISISFTMSLLNVPFVRFLSVLHALCLEPHCLANPNPNTLEEGMQEESPPASVADFDSRLAILEQGRIHECKGRGRGPHACDSDLLNSETRVKGKVRAVSTGTVGSSEEAKRFVCQQS